MWVVTGLSILGVILNIRKSPACYGIWLVTNASWLIYDISLGAFEQAALFGVYFVLSVWGLIAWTRKGDTA